MITRRFFIFFLLILSSCSIREQDERIIDKLRTISARVTEETKTSLSGNELLFSAHDEITVHAFTSGVAQDYLNTFSLSNTEADVNSFSGVFLARDSRITEADYYALYPDNSSLSGTTVTCVLPSVQEAPFDPASTIMLAHDNAVYDEDNMPSLSLTFNQLLAPLRITITNDIESYETDELRSVVISSSDNICGIFSFNLNSPSTLDFSSGEKKLSSQFEDGTLLGKSASTVVMIRPGEIANTHVKIITDKRIFEYVLAEGGPVLFDERYINVLTLNTASVTPTLKKVVACWGDSFTNRTLRPPTPNACNYPEHLQVLLGDEWYVYNGGYNSNQAYDITNHIRLWELENDADVSVVYMGRNHGHQNYVSLKGYYDQAVSYFSNSNYILVEMHNRQYWPEAEYYPVVVSESEILDYRYDPQGYSYYDTLVIPFRETGKSIDFYHTITSDWKNWLVRVGRYNSIGEINEAVEFPGSGTGSDGAVMIDSDGDGIKDLALDWPQSFWYTNNPKERAYVHPSKWGAKAMALMIYDKMVELGYLDD